jgi:hypothetical protein
MPSALNTKINSYTLEKGLEFDAAVTTTPPQTGSITAKTMVLSNSASIAYESTVNPAGGSGSWKLTMTGTETGPISAPRVTYNTLAQYEVFKDGDWSLGFWWKLNTQMVSTRSSNVWNISPFGTNNPGVVLSYQGSNATSNAGRLTISIGDSLNAPISQVINLNTWYYIAVTRVNTTNIGNVKAYINGVNTFTGNHNILTPTANTTQAKWGDTNSYANYSWNISNSYYTTSSVIGPTQIAEIYTAGLGTVPRTVKYYNGTAWVNSSAQKVYNGTAWVDWNAKRFDGSVWINV